MLVSYLQGLGWLDWLGLGLGWLGLQGTGGGKVGEGRRIFYNDFDDILII